MAINLENYYIEEETYLKAVILTRGVEFSEDALIIAQKENAKGQNQVYNMPLHAAVNRPQEIMITNKLDGYSVVVSCVSPNPDTTPIVITTDGNGCIIALVDEEPIHNIEIHFVEEPKYYQDKLLNGENVKKYVSACGLDELNILPWKGCAISKGCRFCGVNSFVSKDDLSAFDLSNGKVSWDTIKKDYLHNLKEAITIAMNDSCYEEHMHVILISGNLSDHKLDMEAQIFQDIAETVYPVIADKATEGLILVITPPEDVSILENLKRNGITKVVFNLEAIQRTYFDKYCPGKAVIGYDYFVERLEKAVELFGRGNSWTNLVFGLEPKEETLELCKQFAQKGIVVSANVLHLDKGNTLDCKVPGAFDVIDFFYRLELINNEQGLLPYYCSKALRTSLSNEAHDARINTVER